MRFLVLRAGARGQLHVAVQQRGAMLLACGRKAPATITRLARGAWFEDDARRCLDCSRKVGAAPSPRGTRQVR